MNARSLQNWISVPINRPAEVDVTPNETWVTVAEWMQPAGCEKYGSDNSVYAARIVWSRPNRLVAGT